MEKIFEHHGHHHKGDGEKNQTESPPKAPEKESAKEKYMDWYHKEENEEAEGDTYGGLM